MKEAGPGGDTSDESGGLESPTWAEDGIEEKKGDGGLVSSFPVEVLYAPGARHGASGGQR